MTDPGELEDLVVYLTQSSRLSAAEARRVIDTVLTFLDESAAEFVRRRHHALQTGGVPNPEIFRRLAAELAARPFRAPACSERQIRRMIYG